MSDTMWCLTLFPLSSQLKAIRKKVSKAKTTAAQSMGEIQEIQNASAHLNDLINRHGATALQLANEVARIDKEADGTGKRKRIPKTDHQPVPKKAKKGKKKRVILKIVEEKCKRVHWKTAVNQVADTAAKYDKKLKDLKGPGLTKVKLAKTIAKSKKYKKIVKHLE